VLAQRNYGGPLVVLPVLVPKERTQLLTVGGRERRGNNHQVHSSGFDANFAAGARDRHNVHGEQRL
jgi:hypothetical protein